MLAACYDCLLQCQQNYLEKFQASVSVRFYPNGGLELWQRQSQKEICGSKSLVWRDMESGHSERKNGREGEGETYKTYVPVTCLDVSFSLCVYFIWHGGVKLQYV